MIRALSLAALLVVPTLAPSVARAEAPEKYRVKFETTAGDFTVECTRRVCPKGADRFHELVEAKFFDECRFFRVVPRFVVQFGINGDPKTQATWREKRITDDPVKMSNRKGTLTFATSGPNTRTSQLFINLKDNDFLDRSGFSPFGVVTEGMDAVEKITAEYGEKPDQGRIQSMGNEYLKANFPNLDYVKTARIVKD